MLEAVEPTDGSLHTLFTLEHFEEMIRFEEYLLNITAPPELADKVIPDSVSFYDLCKKKNITDDVITQQCEFDPKYCLDEI